MAVPCFKYLIYNVIFEILEIYHCNSPHYLPMPREILECQIVTISWGEKVCEPHQSQQCTACLCCEVIPLYISLLSLFETICYKWYTCNDL